MKEKLTTKHSLQIRFGDYVGSAVLSWEEGIAEMTLAFKSTMNTSLSYNTTPKHFTEIFTRLAECCNTITNKRLPKVSSEKSVKKKSAKKKRSK